MSNHFKINTVELGDCKEVIHRLPDKSVNLALCSPPYPDKRVGLYPTVSEKDFPTWTAQWMDSLVGKLADDGSVLMVIDKHVKDGVMSDFLLLTQLVLRQLGWKQHMTHIWFKHDGHPRGHRWWPQHCYEEILWFSRTTHPFCDPWADDSAVTKLPVGKYAPTEWSKADRDNSVGKMRDVLVVPVGGHSKGVEHPAMYSQTLCESLIKTFSPEGGTILDCFAGSGTTLLAARATGRNFYGIDVMSKYVDLARRRLAEGGPQAA